MWITCDSGVRSVCGSASPRFSGGLRSGRGHERPLALANGGDAGRNLVPCRLCRSLSRRPGELSRHSGGMGRGSLPISVSRYPRGVVGARLRAAGHRSLRRQSLQCADGGVQLFAADSRGGVATCDAGVERRGRDRAGVDVFRRHRQPASAARRSRTDRDDIGGDVDHDRLRDRARQYRSPDVLAHRRGGACVARRVRDAHRRICADRPRGAAEILSAGRAGDGAARDASPPRRGGGRRARGGGRVRGLLSPRPVRSISPRAVRLLFHRSVRRDESAVGPGRVAASARRDAVSVGAAVARRRRAGRILREPGARGGSSRPRCGASRHRGNFSLHWHGADRRLFFRRPEYRLSGHFFSLRLAGLVGAGACRGCAPHFFPHRDSDRAFDVGRIVPRGAPAHRADQRRSDMADGESVVLAAPRLGLVARHRRAARAVDRSRGARAAARADRAAAVAGGVTALCRAALAPRQLWLLLAIAAAIGAADALSVLPWGVVTGTSRFWDFPHGIFPASTFDMATNWVGYRYFVHAPWQVPLLETPLLDGGTNVFWLDCGAWILLIAKAIYSVTGTAMNLYGPYLFLCFALPSVAMTVLLATVGQQNVVAALAGSVLAGATPYLLFRWGHIALSAQFVILFALVLYARDRRGAMS